ncbi:unnamed protein product [Periconia digitata]|uniref:Mannan endo-1,6-alpha-mannosidase n=1 Tax=Periconia digitata TaxID=1303443 RepID=A0A9W4UCZ5_9PLEO|nr:unnamed protein product [Periconia digitata]
MFAHLRPLVLVALCGLFPSSFATLEPELDVNSQDSIKNATQILAKAIIQRYNDRLPGEAPGLFDEPNMDLPYAFGQTGAVWGSLLEYGHLTGDSQYNELVSKALTHQLGTMNNFMPQNQTKTLGNNDQASFGITAVTAAEVGLAAPEGEAGQWIDIASRVFNNLVERWDMQACSGGLHWQIFQLNNGYQYMNTDSAANFFVLSARLAQFTGNKTYSDWADKVYQWTVDHKFIEDFKIYDGASAMQNCSKVEPLQWTSNHGLFTEGAAVMYNLTNGTDKWKTVVEGLTDSVDIFIGDNKALIEVACETLNNDCGLDQDTIQNKTMNEVLDAVGCVNAGTCNLDQRAFKGIAAHSYYRTIRVAPFTSEKLQPILSTSAKMAETSCVGPFTSRSENTTDNVSCAFQWKKGVPNDVLSNVVNDLGEMHNALAVVQGLLWPQAKTLATSSSSVGSGSSGSSSDTPNGAAGSNNGDAPKNNAVGRVQASWGLLALFGGFFLVGM